LVEADGVIDNLLPQWWSYLACYSVQLLCFQNQSLIGLALA